MGQLKFAGDDPEGALPCLDQAISALGEQRSPLDLASARGNRALVLLRLGRGEEAGRDAEQADGLLKSVPGDPKTEQESIPVRNTLGIVAYTRSDYAAAGAFFERNAALCRRYGQKQGLGATLTNLAAIEDERGRLSKAESLYGEAAEVLRAISDKKSIGKTLQGLALLKVRQGIADGTLEIAQEALDLAQETGDRNLKAKALRAFGALSVLVGKYANALACLTEGRKICREVRDLSGAAVSGALLAETLLLVGALDDAASAAQAALAEGKSSGHRYAIARAEMAAALVQVSQRELYEAAANFNRAEAILSRLPSPRELCELYLRRTHYLLEQEDLKGADGFLRKAGRLFAEPGADAGAAPDQEPMPRDFQVEILLARGKRAVHGGAAAEGVSFLEKALGAARASKLLGLEWKIEAVLSLAAGKSGDLELARRQAESARAHLQAAVEGLSEVDRSRILSAPDVKMTWESLADMSPPPPAPAGEAKPAGAVPAADRDTQGTKVG